MINKTYVINLERKVERKNNILNEFNKANPELNFFNYVFFKAIDGKTENLLELYSVAVPKWRNRHTGKIMTNGEIGCALSHYLIWKEIVDTAEKLNNPESYKVLIMEDDIFFVNDFVDKFKLSISEIDFDFDLLYLGRDACELHTEHMVKNHIRTVSYSYGAHAYILTYTGAKKLTSCNFLENIIPIDDFLAIMYGCPKTPLATFYDNSAKLNCYSIFPNIVGLTNPFESDTYSSDGCVHTQKYMFNYKKEIKEFVLVVDLTTDSINKNLNSFERFESYAKIYGIPLCIKKLSEFSITELENTLILKIQTPHCIPVCEPKELIDKFFKFTTENQVLSSIDNIMHIGWGIDFQKASNIVVDSNCEIFGQLNGMNLEKLKIEFRRNRIFSKVNQTYPWIFYTKEEDPVGDKLLLNQIENYTGNNWNEYYGYGTQFNQITTPFPKVFIVVKLTNSKENVQKNLSLLDYPIDKLDICYVTNDKSKINNLDFDFCADDCSLYPKIFEKLTKSDSDYLFYFEEQHLFTNPLILQTLLSYKKDVVAPLIKAKNSLWCNFWGAISETGFYKRSFDYADIVNSVKIGLWNVPYVTGVFLVKKDVLKNYTEIYQNDSYVDFDMKFCYWLRTKSIFMYLSNLQIFGTFNNLHTN